MDSNNTEDTVDNNNPGDVALHGPLQQGLIHGQSDGVTGLTEGHINGRDSDLPTSNALKKKSERQYETLECRKRKIHEFIEELSHELSEPKKFTPVLCGSSCACDSAIVRDLDQLINILQSKKSLVCDKLQAVKQRKTIEIQNHVQQFRNENLSMNKFVSKVEDILTKDGGSYLQRAGDISRSLLDLSALNSIDYTDTPTTPAGSVGHGAISPSEPFPSNLFDWSHNSTLDLTNTSLLNTSYSTQTGAGDGVYSTTPPSDEDELDLSDLLDPVPLYSGASLKAFKKVRVLQFCLLQPLSLPPYVTLDNDGRSLTYETIPGVDEADCQGDIEGPCVTLLGYIPLSSGRYYWEIDVYRCQSFSIGLAQENVTLDQTLGEDTQSWALTSDLLNSLNLVHNGVKTRVRQSKPRMVGLLFDADEGTLEVYNADDDRYIAMVFPDPELLWFPAVSMNAPSVLTINNDVSSFHSYLM